MRPVYRHSFRLPDPKPPQPGWGLASAVVHAALIAVFLATAGGTVARSVAVRFIDISDAGPGNTRQQEMQLDTRGAPTEVPSGVAEPVAARRDSSSIPAYVSAPRVVPIGVPPKELGRHDAVIGDAPVLGPSYGSGNIWVGPLEGRLGVTGPSPNPSTHVARVDSAVRARIMALIDTMPPDSFGVATSPDWVTEIDGKKWGTDGSWIYLGDVRLPAAVLALLGFLPLPQGNYEMMQQERELGRVREQIMRQAQQMETNSDIRRYIQEIRKRRDREREEARQRALAEAQAKRDSIKP